MLIFISNTLHYFFFKRASLLNKMTRMLHEHGDLVQHGPSIMQAEKTSIVLFLVLKASQLFCNSYNPSSVMLTSLNHFCACAELFIKMKWKEVVSFLLRIIVWGYFHFFKYFHLLFFFCWFQSAYYLNRHFNCIFPPFSNCQ